jgi:hypothetical protein
VYFTAEEEIMSPKGYLENIEKIYRQYKDLGDKSLARVNDTEIHWKPEPESNSIAIIVQHVAGNLRSRWTDFLTSDGEKPWRERDAEFEERSLPKSELLRRWEEGWAAVFNSLDAIDDAAMDKPVVIRGRAHTVVEALNRSVAHTAYHVGQIVYLAKALRGAGWKSLSIPKGGSKEYKPQP